MEILKGEIENYEKKFALINTTDYNFDKKYQISVFTLDEADKLGFNEEDKKKIDLLIVGEQAVFEYGIDAQVVRLG